MADYVLFKNMIIYFIFIVYVHEISESHTKYINY